jgi:hypothetical protein
LYKDGTLDQVAQHLVGEERVAVGALGQGGGQRARVVGELVARRRREEVLDTLTVEAAQREPLSALGSVDISE